MLQYPKPVKLETSQQPLLLVVVDAEAEFDWDHGPYRDATGVSSMKQIDRVQAIFDQYGIVPCYTVDYPVATQPDGNRLLAEYVRDGRCEIGAHLHSWVTPPHQEEVNLHNSFAGNLPRELELQKTVQLRDAITNHIGVTPTAFKAGRYGIGANTPGILRELGFEIDLSFCPAFDYSKEGGPDFTDHHAEPFWFGPDNQLLEIPVTGAFTGWAGPMRAPLYQIAKRLNNLKACAILSRMRAVDRLMLSPEGYTFDEHVQLTQHLMSQGVRTFTWNFHSPSVVPGFTPYVQSEKDLSRFLDAFHRYFDFFLGELGGITTTPTQLYRRLSDFPQ